MTKAKTSPSREALRSKMPEINLENLPRKRKLIATLYRQHYPKLFGESTKEYEARLADYTHPPTCITTHEFANDLIRALTKQLRSKDD